MRTPKIYYHVIEQFSDNFGHIGYYETEEEARKETEKMQEYYPKSFFYVEAYPTKKEPYYITV